MRFGADFSALIDRFSPDLKQPIALAVSGGSDSLAMLSLCQQWAEGARRRLVVFTVDHGLRPEAGLEAAAVAERCNASSIAHQTLRWTDPKQTQSAARAARYRLLARGASEAGARCLLTGHTLDDVIETALIRRRRAVRGPMQAGPVGAAPIPAWPDGRGIALLRPLLRTTRQALRTYLAARGMDWIDDPSNDNPSFERVRVRQFLVRQEKLAAIAMRNVTTLQDKRAMVDADLGNELGKICVRSDGLIESNKAALSPRLVGLLARCASGGDRDARAGAVAAMLAKMTVPGTRQTLGGAWFQWTGAQLLVGRDPAMFNHRPANGIFDGRFVSDPGAHLPDPADASFLVRHALPPASGWREIVSERIAQIQHCYQTPIRKNLVEGDLILPLQSHDTGVVI